MGRNAHYCIGEVGLRVGHIGPIYGECFTNFGNGFLCSPRSAPRAAQTTLKPPTTIEAPQTLRSSRINRRGFEYLRLGHMSARAGSTYRVIGFALGIF